jgi:hypothetical protein
MVFLSRLVYTFWVWFRINQLDGLEVFSKGIPKVGEVFFAELLLFCTLLFRQTTVLALAREFIESL